MSPHSVEQVGHRAILDEVELLDEILVRVAGPGPARIGDRDSERSAEEQVTFQLPVTDARDRPDDCGAGGDNDNGGDDSAVMSRQRLLNPPAELAEVRSAEDDGERRRDGERQVTPLDA